MSKRRSKRPSPGSQLGKPSGSDPFIISPFIEPTGIIRNRKLQLKPKETAVDPILQMPGVMGKPPRGRGYIPLSGGPKVKIDDKVGPPEDIIRKANRPKTVDGNPNSQTIIPTVSPRKKGEGQPRPGRKVRGNYSNPLDFIKPSDLLTPVPGQPKKLPAPNEGFGPTDEPYGPIDTRARPKSRTMKPVPVVPPVPFPPKEEVVTVPPHSPSDNGGGGVFYFEKGRFLTRGKYNAEKIARATQRRG